MKTIFLLLFIAGILADNSYPQISIHPNENNCDNYRYEPNPRSARTPMQVLVDSNSDFAFKLLRKISSSESYQGDRSNLYPEKQFLNGLKNFYGGDTFWENFNNNAATEQHINSCIKRKTRGKISKLVDEVDPITEILLISYIYMKGTQLLCEYSHGLKVPMMFQMGMFEIGRDDEKFCMILKMPYEGHTAAYFILPDKGQLERVASSLSCGVLQKWKSILSE
ncbi:hypothetical protein E2320_021565, partial [Naja naja]